MPGRPRLPSLSYWVFCPWNPLAATRREGERSCQIHELSPSCPLCKACLYPHRNYNYRLLFFDGESGLTCVTYIICLHRTHHMNLKCTLLTHIYHILDFESSIVLSGLANFGRDCQVDCLTITDVVSVENFRSRLELPSFLKGYN